MIWIFMTNEGELNP